MWQQLVRGLEDVLEVQVVSSAFPHMCLGMFIGSRREVEGSRG